MGNAESIKEHSNNMYTFKKQFNWIPSYPLKEYEIITLNNLSKIVGTAKNNNKTYVDLRTKCPPILDIKHIPIHPVASMCSILHYQLIKNKLVLFPPSRVFIYKNSFIFPEIRSLISFEALFKSIETYGFCSEIDYNFNIENLENEISNRHYKEAEAFKFVNIFRVHPSLEVLKIMLQNEFPILAGIVLYQDLSKITNKLWLPESNKKRLGGISTVLVGYSDDIECFFAKFSLGKNFGISGYIMIPYKYILNIELTPELFYIDLNRNKIEGFLNQKKQNISLEDTSLNKKQSYQAFF